jgi:hypothetical protein
MALIFISIPIRVWTWPGNANDQALIRQVKADLRAFRHPVDFRSCVLEYNALLGEPVEIRGLTRFDTLERSAISVVRANMVPTEAVEKDDHYVHGFIYVLLHPRLQRILSTHRLKITSIPHRARRKLIERDPRQSPVFRQDQQVRGRQTDDLTGTPVSSSPRPLIWFLTFLMLILVILVAGPLVPALFDLSLPLAGSCSWSGAFRASSSPTARRR